LKPHERRTGHINKMPDYRHGSKQLPAAKLSLARLAGRSVFNT
jgi:hypothetical protein